MNDTDRTIQGHRRLHSRHSPARQSRDQSRAGGPPEHGMVLRLRLHLAALLADEVERGGKVQARVEAVESTAQAGGTVSAQGIMSRTMPTLPGYVYALDSLWWGVSIGGRHYTGHVKWTDLTRCQTDGSCYCRHEMERKLSLREAKELDPDAGERYWKSGIRRETNRFETRESLDKAAAQWVAARHKPEDTWILFDYDTLNPRRVLGFQGWDKDRVRVMTEFAGMWDKVPDRARENKTIWNAGYAAWGLLTGSNRPLTKTQATGVTKRVKQITRALKGIT